MLTTQSYLNVNYIKRDNNMERAYVYMLHYTSSAGRCHKKILAYSEEDAIDKVADWYTNIEADWIDDEEAARDYITFKLACIQRRLKDYREDIDITYYRWNVLTDYDKIVYDAAGIDVANIADMEQLKQQVFNYIHNL